MKKASLVFIIKFIFFSLLLAFVALLFNIFFIKYISTSSFQPHYKNEKDTLKINDSIPIIIIDAGHGGEDGGAVGINGVLEKDLNFAISLILNDMFKVSDIPVILTRTEDKMLYTENVKGKKKAYDLKNRVLISENNPNSIYVSIHMNKFPEEKYHGLQVYYSPNHTKSSEFADIIQNYTKLYLQPDNKRETKKASSNIFILNRIKTPAVLIECGFLSNNDEAALLSTDEYQYKLACTIYSAIIEFLNAM